MLVKCQWLNLVKYNFIFIQLYDEMDKHKIQSNTYYYFVQPRSGNNFWWIKKYQIYTEIKN